MKIILRNILAVVAGLLLGSVVNMGIISLSSSIVPLPAGIDPSNMESLKSSMHLFEAKHFIMPFLAHALGTLVGAFVASWIAFSRKMTFAYIVGAFFLIGGIANVFILPAPLWFCVLDLAIAYIPMAWIGGKFGQKLSKSNA